MKPITNSDTFLSRGTPCQSSDQNVINRAKVILEEIQKKPGNLISLDSGCGYGAYLHVLATQSLSVYAIDIDRSFLNQARLNNPHLTNLYISQASLENIGFSSSKFDFIICIETLEHIANDEAVIAEFKRILKPCGSLIISVPYKWFPYETHGIRIGNRRLSSLLGLGFPLLTFLPEKIRRYFATARVYSRKQIIGMLRRNGFTDFRVVFLMPGLDNFERKSRSKFFAAFLRKFLSFAQNLFIHHWGSTIIVITNLN